MKSFGKEEVDIRVRKDIVVGREINKDSNMLYKKREGCNFCRENRDTDKI